MDLVPFDMRDAVLVFAVGIGVYLAFLLLRLLRIGHRKKPAFEVHATPPRVDLDLDAMLPSPAAEPAANFGEALQLTRLEQELAQLREEVQALRKDLAELQAARRVSPQYSDAMALARRGYDARGIADHCGIALGEAELVMALARGSQDFDTETDHAGDARDAYAAG